MPSSTHTHPTTVRPSSDAPGASVPGRRDLSRFYGRGGSLTAMKALGRVVYANAVIRGKECRVRCWIP